MNLRQVADRTSDEAKGRLCAQLDEPRVAGASGAKLDDFQTMNVIGAGAFAQVALVQHVSSSSVYVLKKMNRNHLVQSGMQKQILHERSVLGYLHHPNIAMMYGTFKSAHSLYMVCEPCMGGAPPLRRGAARGGAAALGVARGRAAAPASEHGPAACGCGPHRARA